MQTVESLEEHHSILFSAAIQLKQLKYQTYTYHCRAILIGVVRHEVKRSAGNSGFIGKISFDAQEASWIQLFDGSRSVVLPVRSDKSSDASTGSDD